MTPKQLIDSITNTCQTLHNKGLISFFNSVNEHPDKEHIYVSWTSNSSGNAFKHPFGSIEQYLLWLQDGEFSCLLFDYSIIRASYKCMGNTVIGHNLLYWPCPFKFAVPVKDLGDICAGIELCMESPSRADDICSLNLRTPMRFDFDPECVNEDHPAVHLHMQFDDTRIDVNRPMYFSTFIKMIFRTFYKDQWSLNDDIGRLHEQQINYVYKVSEPTTNCLHFTWT